LDCSIAISKATRASFSSHFSERSWASVSQFFSVARVFSETARGRRSFEDPGRSSAISVTFLVCQVESATCYKICYKSWMRLSYHRWGSNAKKMIFLHGMGGTGALWRPIAAGLENDFEILAPDQRGHGGSIHAGATGEGGGYTPLDYGRDVIETTESLGFFPYWVIGHSMGVRTACAVAYLAPERVSGLVLVDLGLSGTAGGGLGDDLAKFLKQIPMEFSSRSEARAYLTANAPDPAMGLYLLAVVQPTPSGAVGFPFDRGALIETIEAAKSTSVRNWVRSLATAQRLPVLILRGAESKVWSREDFEAERASFAGCPSVVFEEVPGTGHGLPFEKRLEFVQRLVKFTG
jgi:pimeloyl-ACP methyl ester carboxylesterase